MDNAIHYKSQRRDPKNCPCVLQSRSKASCDSKKGENNLNRLVDLDIRYMYQSIIFFHIHLIYFIIITFVVQCC